MNFDQLGHVAKIGDERHLRAIGAKCKSDGVGRIVRYLKRMNINVANGEMLAGLDGFDTPQALCEPIRQGAVQRVHRGLRDVERRLPQAQHLRETIAMIEVFVGDEDAVDVVDTEFDGREARQSFAFAEATVHQESGALRLEQCNVARAA